MPVHIFVIVLLSKYVQLVPHFALESSVVSVSREYGLNDVWGINPVVDI